MNCRFTESCSFQTQNPAFLENTDLLTMDSFLNVGVHLGQLNILPLLPV